MPTWSDILEELNTATLNSATELVRTSIPRASPQPFRLRLALGCIVTPRRG